MGENKLAKLQLIIGGARSGKSALAEQYAKQSNLPVTYLATGQAYDDEMKQRIRLHQQQRPDHWQLIESPVQLADTIESELVNAKKQQQARCLLVDCLTLWLSNCLCQPQFGNKHDQTCEVNLVFWQQQKQQLLEILETAKHQPWLNIILVSNEVGHGIVPMGALSRHFVDQAGWMHQAIAKIADQVEFVMAGIPLKLKAENE